MEKKVVLEVQDLSIGIDTEEGTLTLVEGIDFRLFQGELFGLVGESGCGKTITSLGLIKVLPEPGGKILSGKVFLHLEERKLSLLELEAKELQKIRGAEIGVIFQEPMMALNPLYTVEFHIKELYRFHREVIRKKKIAFENRVVDLMKKMKFASIDTVLNSYPHQLSGGMLQRIVILLAILLKPKIIIADEPTTSLDVTVQAQIMEILKELQEEEETAILFITHNISLLARYAGRLAVMYAGRIVEESDIEHFLEKPLHPYSEGLLMAIPDLFSEKKPKGIPGTVPPPKNYTDGCRFANRCHIRMAICDRNPGKVVLNSRSVSCWKYRDVEGN